MQQIKLNSMTDKEKIREEVERLRKIHQMKYQQLDADSSMSLVECGKRNLCNELLSFIDSLQSEEDDDDAWLNDIISKAECSLQLNKGEIDWLKSLKDRAQPKQEWSEEDDQYLLVCKNALRKYQASDKWDAGIISRWLENKLKAPQSQWKPSNEQMDALKDVIENHVYDCRLEELLEQLKKLREE
jgi:hypothetical protein